MTEPTQNLTNQSTITLREITRETLNSILDLNVAKSQEDFVAPNAWSIAEAHFSKHAWFRSIYADETPVGFLMLHDQPDAIDGSHYYLWRFMIDERYQKMGFGRQAIHLLIDHVKTRPNATTLYLSYVPADGGPRDFYAGIGFKDTGKEEDGELEMKLEL